MANRVRNIYLDIYIRLSFHSPRGGGCFRVPLRKLLLMHTYWLLVGKGTRGEKFLQSERRRAVNIYVYVY